MTNPLARSRLEAASVKLSNSFFAELCPVEYETLLAALDHLLKPEVMDEMDEAAIHSLIKQGVAFDEFSPGIFFEPIYKAMIAELTKE
jgi:hypothetical protein